jgi:type IV pilus assembly protein PilA
MMNPCMPKTDTGQGGFTLIELMLVLAIISILVLISLPAYMDFTVRTKVSEGLVLAGPMKVSVVDYWSQSPTGQFPTNNTQAGLDAPASYATDIVAGISVGTVPSDGTITITFALTELGTDNQLQLVPSVPGSAVEWSCQSALVNGIRSVYVPAICR